MRKTFSCLMMMVAISVIAFHPESLAAQSIWLDRHDNIALEVLKPNFKNDDNASLSSLALFLALRMPLSEQLNFVGELPFAHVSYEERFYSAQEQKTESTFGNPYLGLEIGQRNFPIFTELGIRLPLTADDKFSAALTGILTDFDRLEAFFPNTIPVTGMINFRHADKTGLVVRLRGGVSYLINTKDEDSELLIGYSAQTGYESERVSFLGGFTGRANMTEENANFGERSVHQLGFAASVGLGSVRPGIHVRLPLDEDMKDIVDAVFGLNFGIQLK